VEAAKPWIPLPADLDRKKKRPGELVEMAHGVRGGRPDAEKATTFLCVLELLDAEERTVRLTAEEHFRQTGPIWPV
jgi:hypothetical protein